MRYFFSSPARIAFLQMLAPVLFLFECHAQHHAVSESTAAESSESMPYAVLDETGRLHMALVKSVDGNRQVLYRRISGDTTFELLISDSADSLSHWPESPPKLERGADGTLHVLYTVRTSPGTESEESGVEMRYRSSSDDGATWAPYRVIADPEVAVYRSCAAMRAADDGSVVFTWLEGHPGQSVVGLKTGTLRDGQFEHAFVDRAVCECCATELLVAPDASIWLGYRDVDERNVRDIYFSRRAAAAESFGDQTRISRDKWVLNGCPDTGPRFALSGDDVWVAWYSGNPRAVFASRAPINDSAFGPRDMIDSVAGAVQGLRHPAIGTLPDGRVVVAYERREDEENRIAVRVRDGDSWSAPTLLGTGEYPRIASNGESALLVYTAIGHETKSISTHNLLETVSR